FAEMDFDVALEVTENLPLHLDGGVVFAAHLNGGLALFVRHDLVREAIDEVLDRLGSVLASKQALDLMQGRVGQCSAHAFGLLSDEGAAVWVDRYDRRHRIETALRGYDPWDLVRYERGAGIGCAEVYANDTAHKLVRKSIGGA